MTFPHVHVTVSVTSLQKDIKLDLLFSLVFVQPTHLKALFGFREFRLSGVKFDDSRPTFGFRESSLMTPAPTNSSWSRPSAGGFQERRSSSSHRPPPANFPA